MAISDRIQAIVDARAAAPDHPGMNPVRARERELAEREWQMSQSSDNPPLSEYEKAFHVSRMVDAFLQGGKRKLATYAFERGMSTSEAGEMFMEVMKRVEMQSELAERSRKDVSVARYEMILEKALTSGDLSNALKAQERIDKVRGTEFEQEQTDLVNRLKETVGNLGAARAETIQFEVKRGETETT